VYPHECAHFVLHSGDNDGKHRATSLGAEKMGIPAAIYVQFALREKFEKDGIS
jgi:hypothetical protein